MCVWACVSGSVCAYVWLFDGVRAMAFSLLVMNISQHLVLKKYLFATWDWFQINPVCGGGGWVRQEGIMAETGGGYTNIHEDHIYLLRVSEILYNEKSKERHPGNKP